MSTDYATEIKHTNDGSDVSVVTVNGEFAFTMGREHTMFGLFGPENPIYAHAHYGDDYLIRDAPGGEVVGRWFTRDYGWTRFWPPGATLPRVERLMRVLYERAERAQQRLVEVSARVVADTSLPRREFTWGHTGEKDVEIFVCGMNRYKNEIEYAVNARGNGDYSVGSSKHTAARSPIGDDFARAADRSMGIWRQYGRLNNILGDLVCVRLLADKKKLGVHRISVNGRWYWWRLFMKRERFGKRPAVESLDEFGSAEITETVIADVAVSNGL